MKEESAVVLESGRLVQWRTGGPAHVDFDWKWVLRREETKGDVSGFFHTHPSGHPAMSNRDRRTMEAWAQCFGKPLLCAIRCGQSVRIWICDGEGGAFEASDVTVLQKVIKWKR